MDQTKDVSTSSGNQSTAHFQQPTQITLHNSNRSVSHVSGRGITTITTTTTTTSPVTIPFLSSPMYNRLESLILSLTDSTKRDDIKYKDLRVFFYKLKFYITFNIFLNKILTFKFFF